MTLATKGECVFFLHAGSWRTMKTPMNHNNARVRGQTHLGVAAAAHSLFLIGNWVAPALALASPCACFSRTQGMQKKRFSSFLPFFKASVSEALRPADGARYRGARSLASVEIRQGGPVTATKREPRQVLQPAARPGAWAAARTGATGKCKSGAM